ncbi:MAG: hypothetical protein FWC35_05845, partial [Proteobacteria bacterium]|nr:hypothetical protein [Pseudomonadota bacterium]
MLKWFAAHRLGVAIIGALVLFFGSVFAGWKTSSWYYGAKDKIRTIAEQRSTISFLEATIREQREKISQHDKEIARRDDLRKRDNADFARLRLELAEIKRRNASPSPVPRSKSFRGQALRPPSPARGEGELTPSPLTPLPQAGEGEQTTTLS